MRWLNSKEVLAMLETAPNAMGAEAAAVLARFTREGQGDAVTSAVSKLIQGELTQEGVIKAVAQPRSVSNSPRPEAIVIRAGKSTYCKIVGVKQTLRIDFVSEADRRLVEGEIQKMLEKHAKTRLA